MAKSPHNEDAAEGGAPAPAKKSMLGKLLVLVLVVVVVAVECTVAYFCIPAASSTAASNSVKPPAEHKKGEADPEDAEANGMVEVDLKEYSVTRYQAASNSTLRVDFHLHGIVAKEFEKDFKDIFEKDQARFREQVRITVDSAEMADLNDPTLGWIKRTILTKAASVFGRPLLKEVLVTDWATMEN